MATVTRYGMWNHQTTLALVSVSYQLNLSNVLAGYPSHRRFDMSVFAGPTMILALKDQVKLAEKEPLIVDHEVKEKDPILCKSGIGAHLGFKLRCRLIPHISAVIEPTFYLLGSTKLPSVDFLTVKYLQTWNIGVQYEL